MGRPVCVGRFLPGHLRGRSRLLRLFQGCVAILACLPHRVLRGGCVRLGDTQGLMGIVRRLPGGIRLAP